MVSRVVQEADVVIEIADARMPTISRNYELEALVRKYSKNLVIVFNKADLVPKEMIKKISKETKERHYFVSARENTGINDLRIMLKIEGKRIGDRPKVAFVGYPNVGKSSVLNALVRRARSTVSAKAGTTRGIQWVNYGDMLLLDSPGVIPIDEWDEVRLSLIGAKNVSKLKNAEKVAYAIVEFLNNVYPGKLEEHYGVVLNEEDDPLESIGKARCYLLKGAKVDIRRTAMAIIADWQRGRLRI